MSRAQRRSVRKHIQEALMVVNSMTGETLGRIGNLSEDGLMLISTQPLQEEWVFQVNFQLHGGAKPVRIEVGIQCLWSEAARSANAFWAGCKIIDISTEEHIHLKAWVDRQTESA